MHKPNFKTAISCLVLIPFLLATPALAQQQQPASVVQVANVPRVELAPTVAVPGTIFKSTGANRRFSIADV